MRRCLFIHRDVEWTIKEHSTYETFRCDSTDDKFGFAKTSLICILLQQPMKFHEQIFHPFHTESISSSFIRSTSPGRSLGLCTLVGTSTFFPRRSHHVSSRMKFFAQEVGSDFVQAHAVILMCIWCYVLMNWVVFSSFKKRLKRIRSNSLASSDVAFAFHIYLKTKMLRCWWDRTWQVSMVQVGNCEFSWRQRNYYHQPKWFGFVGIMFILYFHNGRLIAFMRLHYFQSRVVNSLNAPFFKRSLSGSTPQENHKSSFDFYE